jgi:hypothetical protein
VILSEADLVAFSLPHVTGLLVNSAIHFFMTIANVFGIDLGFPLATWPLGSNKASFLLGDDGGFKVVDNGGLGRGSEIVWRLNASGGLGSGDGGALRDGGFGDVGLGLGSKGV